MSRKFTLQTSELNIHQKLLNQLLDDMTRQRHLYGLNLKQHATAMPPLDKRPEVLFSARRRNERMNE